MRQEAKIGLSVLVAIAIIYVVVAWTRRLHFFAPKVTSYELMFADVSGLLEGDPVMIRGYQAGRVKKIRPSADLVTVSVGINSDIPIYQDAKAEIQIKEIMGGKQVSISPGTQGSRLPPGAHIEGRTALDFSSSFSQVGRLLDGVNQQKIDVLWQRFDRISRQLETMMVNIDAGAPKRILNNLDRSTQRLNALTEPISPERIDQTWQQVETMLTRADSALTRVEFVADSLNSAIGPRTDSLLNNLNHTLVRVDHLASMAEDIAQQLRNEESLAGRLISDPELSRQLDSTLYHLNETLKQIHREKVIVGFRKKK